MICTRGPSPTAPAARAETARIRALVGRSARAGWQAVGGLPAVRDAAPEPVRGRHDGPRGPVGASIEPDQAPLSR